MDRRNALKSFGAIAATTVYSTSIISLLASCQEDSAKNLKWEPKAFSADQADAMTKLLDVYLPSGDTPGAVELGVQRFVDRYISDAMEAEDAQKMKDGAAAFMTEFTEKTGIAIADATSEDLQPYMAEKFKSHRLKMEAADPSQFKELEDPVVNFLGGVRGLGVWGWKNTKKVAEEVLWYDPIPTKFVGCRDLNAEGDGKLMSL